MEIIKSQVTTKNNLTETKFYLKITYVQVMRNVIVVWIIEHAGTLVVMLQELIHGSCITTKVLFHVGDIIMNFASNLLIAYGFMDLLVSS